MKKTNVLITALSIFAMLIAFASASANMKQKAAEKLDMMDTNNDEKLSAEEFTTGKAEKFKKMDTNGDGYVTVQEMEVVWKTMKHPKGHHKMSAADKVAKLDTDKDGKVSAAEHEAGAKTMFTEIDMDKDGYITVSEMETTHKQMKK